MLPNRTTGLSEPAQRVAARWAHWVILPRLRRRLASGQVITSSVVNATHQLEQVHAFLHQLETGGGTLAGCTQSEIDAWFAGPGAARWQVRPLLAWAQQRLDLPRTLVLPPMYKGTPVPGTDPDLRRDAASRLLNDNTLDPADRIAGALIVLYAQSLPRIVTLTRDDVRLRDDDVITLKLGADPLELPEPLASLIRQLPRTRRAGTAQVLPNRWLFPGAHAGTHLSPTTLAARMRLIDIEPRSMRLAAIDQLARDVPPAMLAGILGITASAANRATRCAGGSWTGYAGRG